MPRTTTAGEDALLDGRDYAIHHRVWVADSTGTLVNLSDSVVRIEIDDTAEGSHLSATVVFDRNDGVDSLAPLMTTPAPIDIGRALVIETANVALGASPGGSDWKEQFRGYVRRTDPTEAEMVVEGWSDAGRLAELWIESVRSYGSDDGVALETVIGSVLSDNGSSLTLYTPASPAAGVSPAYDQSQESVLQACRTLGESIGWSVRDRWSDSEGAFRFTLWEPPRTNTTADWTVGPDRYLRVRSLEVNIEDIRNVVEVEFTNQSTGAREAVTVSDAASIAKYGRRYMKISEAGDSPIRNTTTATALANAALDDLSEPEATHEIETLYVWHLQVGDLIEFTANNVHYTANQKLAVVNLRHVLENGTGRTIITTRGKPTGGVLTWRQRDVRVRGSARVGSQEEYGLVDFREMAPATPGNRRWGWTRRGRQVDEVWVAFRVYDAPWDEDNYADVKTFVLPIPDDEEYVEIANADLPDAAEVGALWVEPRITRGDRRVVYSEEVIERRKVMPVPADIDVDLTASIVSNAVDLSVKLTAAASSKPYPASVLIWEGEEDTGTLLARFGFEADGTRTKANDAAIGGRALPAEGKQEWVAVVTDVAGNEYRDRAVVNAPRQPYFDGVRSVLAANLLSVDIYGTVVDPGGLGGTLEYWLPADAETPADPSGAATGSVVIAAASMPYDFDPTNVDGFSGITVAGNAFAVFLKFTATDGRSTGAQKFTLDSSMQFLVDELGLLKAESVHNGLVLAQTYRPYYVGSGAPSLAPADYGTNRYFDSASLTAYLHNGSAWVVDASTPTISYAPILRAGVVTTSVMAAEAVTADILGADSVIASKVASIALEVGKYIQSTSYSAGSSGWRINADGSAEFNNVTVRGTVAAMSFSGTYMDMNSGTIRWDFLGPHSAHGIQWVDGSLGTVSNINSDGLDLNIGVHSSGVIFVSGDTELTGTLEVSGAVTAPVFTGDLAGNADSATTAADVTGTIDGQAVSFGASDSGGTGFRVVRVPN